MITCGNSATFDAVNNTGGKEMDGSFGKGLGEAIVFLLWATGLSFTALLAFAVWTFFFQETASDLISDAAVRCQAQMQVSTKTELTECTIGLKLIFQNGKVLTHNWETAQ